MADVLQDPAADHAGAVAHHAVGVIEVLALLQGHLADALGQGRRLGNRRQRGQGGQLRGAVQLEGQHAADVAHAGRGRRVAADQAEDAAPAGHHRHVLHIVQGPGHRPGDDPGLGRKGPELLAAVGGVGGEAAALGHALEHQVAGRGQGAAVPGPAVVDPPGLLLRDRVPGQQVAGHGFARDRGHGDQGVGAQVPLARIVAEAPGLEVVGAGDVLRRDVDQPGLRVEGHGMPGMGAEGRGVDDRPRLVVARGRDLDRPPGDRVDAGGPGHLGEGLGRDQLPGRPVQDIEEAVLRRLHQHLALAALDLQVGQDDRLGRGVVPGVARRGLIPPDHVAVVGPEGDDRREVEVVAAARAAGLARPGRAVADAEVEQVQLRVVDDGVPDRAAAAADLPPAAVPGRGGAGHGGVLEGLGRVAGHGVEAPALLAGLGVIGGDVAADAELGAAVADDHHPLGDPRRAGDGVGLLRVDGPHLPFRLAGRGVQGDQAAVDGAHVDPALPDRDPAVDHVAAGVAAPLPRHLRVVGPEHLAGAAVDRPDHAPGAGGVEDAVDHDRGRLDAAVGAGVDRPGQAEASDVLVVDLVERAVALLGVGPAMGQPVARLGVGGPDAGLVDAGGGRRAGGEQDGGGRRPEMRD